LVEQCEPGPMRDELLRQMTRAYAALDAAEAMDWIAELPDDDRNLTAKELSAQIARYDVASAIEVADRFHVGRDDGTLEHLVQLWATEAPAAAQTWIEAQPPGPEREQLLARIAFVQAGISSKPRAM
jgi:hypothetical protein